MLLTCFCGYKDSNYVHHTTQQEKTDDGLLTASSVTATKQHKHGPFVQTCNLTQNSVQLM